MRASPTCCSGGLSEASPMTRQEQPASRGWKRTCRTSSVTRRSPSRRDGWMANEARLSWQKGGAASLILFCYVVGCTRQPPLTSVPSQTPSIGGQFTPVLPSAQTTQASSATFTPPVPQVQTEVPLPAGLRRLTSDPASDGDPSWSPC